jgi:tetratricopeptide (TPR) repeat protein
MRWTLVAVMAMALGVLAPTVAQADDQPWALGVTDAQKAQAQKILEEGNQLFLKKDYAQALDKYKAAVAVWDHPAIRFNMVRCLIQLDRPVDASDNLALALKYGAAPLEEAVYNEALSYQKLLASQIGDLDVACAQPGVKITLDGQPLLDCPGKEHRRVAPGQHQLVGTKDGFLTKTTEVVVIGAKQQDAKVALVPLSKAAKVVHRYPTWMPWTVFGGGLVLAGFGGLIQYEASQSMASYDRQVTQNCAGGGCTPDQVKAFQGDKDAAERDNKIAIGVITVGAAGAIVGGVLLYMNRGRTVYEEQGPPPAPQVGFAPVRDGGGVLTFSGSF